MKCTIQYLQMIFGKETDLALDYLAILLQQPQQKLPVLVLEGETAGKTTFANWIFNLFPYQTGIITEDAFVSHFNSSWATNLLTCIDEICLDKDAVIRKINAIKHGEPFVIKERGKEDRKIIFKGNIIALTQFSESSNTAFAGTWHIRLNKLSSRHPFILQSLSDEIDEFRAFLQKRKVDTRTFLKQWRDFPRTQNDTGVDLFINNGPITNPFQFLYVAAAFILNPFIPIRYSATDKIHVPYTIIRSTLVAVLDIVIAYLLISRL